jgi:hypothetical protein
MQLQWISPIQETGPAIAVCYMLFVRVAYTSGCLRLVQVGILYGYTQPVQTHNCLGFVVWCARSTVPVIFMSVVDVSYKWCVALIITKRQSSLNIVRAYLVAH